MPLALLRRTLVAGCLLAAGPLAAGAGIAGFFTPTGFGTEPGETLILLGDTHDEFDGSIWAQVAHDHLGGVPPQVDLERERLLSQILVAGSRDGLISAAHDLSEGGLIQAVVESALAGETGCRIILPDGADPFVWLFSESAGRVLVSVPRIYERVHAKVLESLAPSRLRTQLFEAAVAVGWRRFCAAQGLPTPGADDARAAGLWSALPWPLLQRLVAKPLLEQFGGRVRVAISGGAPLSASIARCFLGLGLPVLQGYGMTETAPVVAVNGLDDNHPASVGRALPGVEVRIGDNRELQVRGPIVMQGYWKRPEDTARILSPEGWLGTGDQAEIVDGRIYIRGRIKEIIVTSTGEKVPPADLELAVTSDPLFEQAFVVGENLPFIACVAVVHPEEWQRVARGLGLDPKDAASLAHPAVLQEALARIARQTAGFARYAVPRAVHLVTEPWSIENGMMTPTLKLKRANLLARHAAAIEAMYQRPGAR